MTTSVRTSSRSAGPIGGRALVGEFEWIVPLLILITVAFGASWIAVVDPRPAWAAGGVGAIVLGTILTGTRSRWIALSLIPASLLTSSAIVPFEGRYIPVLMLTAALAISLRTRAPAALVFLRQLPRPFVVTVSIYLAWAAIATVVSISFTDLEYLGGMAATLGQVSAMDLVLGQTHARIIVKLSTGNDMNKVSAFGEVECELRQNLARR